MRFVEGVNFPWKARKRFQRKIIAQAFQGMEIIQKIKKG